MGSHAGTEAVDRGKEWLVEDFEQPSGRSGGIWYEFDKHSLGTIAQPDPFVLTPSGASGSPGHCAHIWGTLGANRAPWSWVQLQISLNQKKTAMDLGEYKSVRFSVKGDGGRYGIAFVKESVTDYDQFHYEFTAPQSWTEVSVPLSELRQHGWGRAVPNDLHDVKQIYFYPAQYDQAFDLSVDHLVLSQEEQGLQPIAYDTDGWFPWKGFEGNFA